MAKQVQHKTVRGESVQACGVDLFFDEDGLCSEVPDEVAEVLSTVPGFTVLRPEEGSSEANSGLEEEDSSEEDPQPLKKPKTTVPAKKAVPAKKR